jgi:hypothetical protein
VKVRGYRAPGFSVTAEAPWFFDAVAEAGYRYDSSVFPGERGHGGLPGAKAVPHILTTEHGDLVEFPISLSAVFGRPMYFFGGGYLRFFPYSLMRAKAKAVLAENRPVIFYLHPREVDPGHPRLPMSTKRRFMTYHNLGSTMPKMRRLFNDLPMTTFGDLLDAGWPTSPSRWNSQRPVDEEGALPIHRDRAVLHGEPPPAGEGPRRGGAPGALAGEQGGAV